MGNLIYAARINRAIAYAFKAETSIERIIGVKVSMSRKRLTGRTGERDKGATTFTLSIYRDRALTISQVTSRFAREAFSLIVLVSCLPSMRENAPSKGVCRSGGLIRVDVEYG